MKNTIIEILRFLKRNYILGIRDPLKGFIYGFNLSNEYNKYKNQKKVILMQTPTHKNLGDHAIVYAQKQFVKDNLKNFKIIEISYNDVYKKSRMIKKVMSRDDIVIIPGGGNMGDLYVYEEYMRRYIIKHFREFKVISFPQTISFSKTLSGKIELYKSKKAYKKNKNLIIAAREKESYEKMKAIYGEEKVILTPDIVLYLEKRDNSIRNGVIICLRNDKEKLLKLSDIEKIYDGLREKYSKITIMDTVLDEDVPICDREFQLNKIWTTIRGAEVVITDRLHGMIFCAITATPCIVFRNSNNKVEETYKNWLPNLSYIKFCQLEEIESIIKIIDELRKNTDRRIQFNDCRAKYGPLKKHLIG